MTEYVPGTVSRKPAAPEDPTNPDWLLFSELLIIELFKGAILIKNTCGNPAHVVTGTF